MDQKVLDFLSNNRISVVTTLLKDGTPHASTLNFSHQEEPLKLPSSAEWKDDPATVLLAFTPTWWRFTDLNTDPYTIISSEQ